MTEAINTEQGNSVYSPPSGFKLRWTLNGHFDIITRIAWAADGKRLASASKDHKIQIWNTESGELVTVLEGHTDTVLDIAWSPNLASLASVSSDDTIKLWNTNTWEMCTEIKKEKCNTIAWSPNGKRFASRSSFFATEHITLWDASTGEKLHQQKNND
jgi:WD40 repeat protein